VALAELNSAIAEFKENYGKYAESNKNFLRVQSDVQRALDKAQFVNDLKQSAAIFGDEILNIMRAMEKVTF